MKYLSNVDNWIALQDYDTGTGIIAKGSSGFNYYEDFKRYAFLTKKEAMALIDLETLVRHPEVFKPEWNKPD